MSHVPVLLTEVLAALAIAPGDHIVDGTYGAGGYTLAIMAAGARVTAFDRDPDAIAAAPVTDGLTVIEDNFAQLDRAGPADGVVLDIGVSSMQLDQAARGFSFQADGPLDMRMAQTGMSAADFLNTADEAAIADVLWRLGEEKASRRIARAIVAARPLATTGDLAAAVKRAIGVKPGERRDPATRTFQAVRIHVNDELGALEAGLAAAERTLKPGGRLAVVTFHSLEDRIVKRFLRTRSGADPAGSRHLPAAANAPAPSFAQIAKPVRASEAEIARNPRARSATLRAAHRTAHAPWTLSESIAS